LIRKLTDRARKFQDQDSRIAILDARCKQGEKELRAIALINAQLDSRCQLLNQQIGALTEGSEVAVKQSQDFLQDKHLELERLQSERAMFEEQILELDHIRDRCALVETQLKAALAEKQMLEDEFMQIIDQQIDSA